MVSDRPDQDAVRKGQQNENVASLTIANKAGEELKNFLAFVKY
jgi:hypothetical protein